MEEQAVRTLVCLKTEKNTRRKCFGKHCVGVPSLLCSSFVVWFLLPLYHSLTQHMFISEHNSVKKKKRNWMLEISVLMMFLIKCFWSLKLAPDGFIHLTGAPTTFNFLLLFLFVYPHCVTEYLWYNLFYVKSSAVSVPICRGSYIVFNIDFDVREHRARKKSSPAPLVEQILQ